MEASQMYFRNACWNSLENIFDTPLGGYYEEILMRFPQAILIKFLHDLFSAISMEIPLENSHEYDPEVRSGISPN